MELKQALEITEQALNIASTKGAFTLQESSTIFAALLIVKNELATKEEAVEPKLVKQK